MSEFAYRHSGGCACGAVTFRYHCNRPAAELEPRACQCSFCRPRAASYVGGGEGRLEVRVRDRRFLYAHVFGTGTADFMHCGRCNHAVYVSSRIDGREYALVCFDALDLDVEAAGPQPMDFDDESLDERLARRAKTWIPDLEVLEYDS